MAKFIEKGTKVLVYAGVDEGQTTSDFWMSATYVEYNFGHYVKFINKDGTETFYTPREDDIIVL